MNFKNHLSLSELNELVKSIAMRIEGDSGDGSGGWMMTFQTVFYQFPLSSQIGLRRCVGLFHPVVVPFESCGLPGWNAIPDP